MPVHAEDYLPAPYDYAVSQAAKPPPAIEDGRRPWSRLAEFQFRRPLPAGLAIRLHTAT